MGCLNSNLNAIFGAECLDKSERQLGRFSTILKAFFVARNVHEKLDNNDDDANNNNNNNNNNNDDDDDFNNNDDDDDGD